MGGFVYIVVQERGRVSQYIVLRRYIYGSNCHVIASRSQGIRGNPYTMQELCQQPGEVGGRRERVGEVGGSRPNKSRGVHASLE